MGYGQYSNDYHKPFNKSELIATATGIENPLSHIIDWKAARLVAKNTLRYILYNPAGIANESIVYHKTRILVLTYDNQLARRPLLSVTVNTGGFNTLTTRERLNRFLPSGWSVFTDKGFLYVRTPSGTFPHVDGATYDGATGKPKQPERHKDSRAVAIAIKRKIDKFCRAIDREGIPMPCAGDPWIFDWNPRAIGESVLIEWLDSEYVNGALIVHAMRRKGWQDGALHMVFTRPDDWRPQVKRAVRDFFKAGLGLA
jgi:hypothetical protein